MKTEKRIIDLPGNQSKLTYEFVTESYNPEENKMLIKKIFLLM